MAVKENDIRPKDLMQENLACIEADRNYLLRRQTEWVEVGCPACRHEDNSFYGEKDGFSYVTCAKCKTVYTSPRPSESLLQEFYAQSMNYEYWNKYIFPASNESRKKGIYTPRAEMMIAECERLGVKGGAFVEVGAGFGSFCEVVRSKNFFNEIIAIEPTIHLAKTCEEKGFTVLNQMIETVDESLSADVISSFEVIEHLFDPAAFLEKCNRLLRPGGAIFLSCPNYKGFDMSTLGIKSDSFDHEHINYFHPQSLSILLSRTGFESIKVFTPGKLDASIIRGAMQDGKIDTTGNSFVDFALGEGWDEYGDEFQSFIRENVLSSHMMAVAQKS